MNKMKIALASALMLFSGVVMAQDVTDKFNSAAELIGQKKYAEAIPLMEQVIKEGLEAGPDAMEMVQQAQKFLPDLYSRKGMTQAQAGKFAEAIADMSKADELAELYGNEAARDRVAGPLTKSYLALGSTSFNNKDYPKAIEVFSQAYAKYPNNTDLALLLAKSYGESGDLAKATETYKSIMDLEEKHSKYAEPAAQAKKELTEYMLIAASAEGANNNLNGVKQYTDVILGYDPANAMTNLMLLQVANNAKNYDAVIALGEAAAQAQTDPEKQAEAYFLLGQAYDNKKNVDQAVAMYNKVTTGEYAAQAKKQATELKK